MELLKGCPRDPELATELDYREAPTPTTLPPFSGQDVGRSATDPEESGGFFNCEELGVIRHREGSVARTCYPYTGA